MITENYGVVGNQWVIRRQYDFVSSCLGRRLGDGPIAESYCPDPVGTTRSHPADLTMGRPAEMEAAHEKRPEGA